MISIIIPVRNEEKGFDEMLSRLTNDIKHTPYELIVSDGNSTDQTVEIARRYTSAVVVEPDPSKRTIGRGRNAGASVARGEYLVFLDADMYLPDPDAFFNRAIGCFEDDPHLVGLMGMICVHPHLQTLADRLGFGSVNAYNILMNNIFHIGSGTGKFQMVKATVFHALHGYREDLVVSEDYELFVRLAKNGRTKVDRSLVTYHSGRRAHAMGWPRLLFSWWINALSYFFFDRSYHREWKKVHMNVGDENRGD